MSVQVLKPASLCFVMLAIGVLFLRYFEVAAPASDAPPRAAPAARPPAVLMAPTPAPARPTPTAPMPATARPVPTAAPAPSCGPPAIRPFAMPGPKIDNPSSARDARISVSASEMVGGSLKPEVK